MAESEEELKNLLMSVKEESQETSLKHNIQKTKIMAYGPITLQRIRGEKVEAVTDFLFLGSKITAVGDCIRGKDTCCLEATTNLDRVLKSRDITLLNNVRIVKAMFFPVVMYRCESWSIKKTEY